MPATWSLKGIAGVWALDKTVSMACLAEEPFQAVISDADSSKAHHRGIQLADPQCLCLGLASTDDED